MVPSSPGHSYWVGIAVLSSLSAPPASAVHPDMTGFIALHVYALAQHDKKATGVLCPHMVAFENRSGV